MSSPSPAGRPAPRVLIVEDERNIRELVVLHAGLEGWTTTAVGDGHEALRAARAEPFDLVILDLMLPGLDGITVCRALRRESANPEVPVLMLTARREEADKVLGLESGADDYLAKPFGVRELMARAHALLRRPRLAAAGDPVQQVTAAGLTVDPARRIARIGDRDVELTGQELTLLHLLASHPGIVYPREMLLARVWKGETHVTVRSVDTLVRRLRRKIEADPANPRFVLTVWGAGYKFADA
ncbi:MAG TPA: response regulator transcription factor [Methylomirabilota bacterium]